MLSSGSHVAHGDLPISSSTRPISLGFLTMLDAIKERQYSMDDMIVSGAQKAVQALAAKLPSYSLKKLGEHFGDQYKLRRLRRLMVVLEKAQEFAQDQGISDSEMRVLADHVGLPWIERASMRDEDELQHAWAHLFVEITTSDEVDLHVRTYEYWANWNLGIVRSWITLYEISWPLWRVTRLQATL